METLIKHMGRPYTLRRCVLKNSRVFYVISGHLKLQTSMLLVPMILYLEALTKVRFADPEKQVVTSTTVTGWGIKRPLELKQSFKHASSIKDS